VYPFCLNLARIEKLEEKAQSQEIGIEDLVFLIRQNEDKSAII